MKRVTLIAAALMVAVFALATQALAQETNTQERSFITFSNTVEMPGVTLPAGTYVFRLADTPQRNVVQVLNQDQTKVLGQWLFVQATRPRVTDDTVVMFKENAENTMPAVQFWYFPGEKIGKEFVYPKNQAEKIASRTGQKVRTDEGYVSPQANTASNEAAPANTASNQSNQANQAAPVSQQASAEQSSSLNQNRANEANVAGSSVGTTGANAERNSAAVGTSGSAQNSSSSSSVNDNRDNQSAANSRTTLPKTGSELPLTALIGLLSLAGAFGVRKFAMAQSE